LGFAADVVKLLVERVVGGEDVGHDIHAKDSCKVSPAAAARARRASGVSEGRRRAQSQIASSAIGAIGSVLSRPAVSDPVSVLTLPAQYGPVPEETTIATSE